MRQETKDYLVDMGIAFGAAIAAYFTINSGALDFINPNISKSAVSQLAPFAYAIIRMGFKLDRLATPIIVIDNRPPIIQATIDITDRVTVSDPSQRRTRLITDGRQDN